MYADIATVKGLCVNRKSNLADSEIQAAASVVEPGIDARLAVRYAWPVNGKGIVMNVPPRLPAQVVAIANLMVAALIEKQTYGQSEAQGLQANPYGVSLDRQGRQMLTDLVEGDSFVPGLEVAVQVGSIGPNPSQRTYRTVSGFTGRRSNF